MDFLLLWDFHSAHPLTIKEDLDTGLSRALIIKDRFRARVVDNSYATIVWLGDFVLPEGYVDEKQYFSDLGKSFDPLKVLSAGGHFYCLYYKKAQRVLYLLTGFAGILPVYYTSLSGKMFVSSHMDHLIASSGIKPQVSHRFVLEKMVFNYPLFQHTVVKDIWMLPTHHLLQLSGSFRVERYFNPGSLIKSDPTPVRKALPGLSHFFQTRLNRYWPNEPFALSFTGGFDGRTLVSCALREHRDFLTYAFGSSDSQDVDLPARQASRLKIPFSPIYLDQPEYLQQSLDDGLELVARSAGSADMARAHYVHAVKWLARDRRYLLTGNFGSELFRAMHLTGEMTAYPTYLIFAGKDPGWVLGKIKASEDYQLLNQPAFREAVEGLMEDVNGLHLAGDSNMTMNQRFYMFVLEEVFRKYFGPEIAMQNHYLTNRTPMLDFQFVKELFSTRLAGIYTDYYQHNPVKRKKGQMWYARVIRDTSRPLYRMTTGKGYAPRYLLHPSGNIPLVWNMLRKKIFANGHSDDLFCVKKAFMSNLEEIQKVPVDANFFDPAYLAALSQELPDHGHKPLLKAFSLNWYIRKINTDAKS